MKPIVILLTVLLIAGCGKSEKKDIQKQIQNKKEKIARIEQEIVELEKKLSDSPDSIDINDIQKVTVQKITPQPFHHFIEVQGALDGDNNVAVYPEGMGVIDEIYVKVGQKVSKGQMLARMNDAAIREQIKGLQTGLDLAKTVYDKQKGLWDQNIGSEVQFLQAKSTKETLEAQLAGAQNQLAMMHIKSPINGTVEESQVKLGQTASPQYPAFRVVNFGKLKVITEVAEAYASKISKGDEVLVFLPDIKEDYKAHVNFASNYINQINRTFRVEADLTSFDPRMKANMVAVLKINDYKNDKAIILPVSYIQKDKDGSFVIVAVKSGDFYTARKIKVITGQIYNGMAEITDGLKAGDQYLTSEYFNVDEGETIRL